MSTLKVSTLQNLSGTEVYTCKAWVNFNGTGTVAIRASGNVSSITDNGLGDYTVNFTSAMPDANYCLTGSGDNSGNAEVLLQAIGLKTTTQCRVILAKPGVSTGDGLIISAAIFR